MENRVSAYMDGLLPGKERDEVAAHLVRCSACATRTSQHQQLRESLRRMGPVNPPEALAMRLQVLASREQARRRERGSYGSWAALWWNHARLWADNLMRPLAIPFAGGLISTMVLFSVLLPTFSPLGITHPNDVPTLLTTDPLLMSASSFGLSDEEIAVDLVIDEQGRMVNYTIQADQPWAKDPELRRSIENTLLFARFQPATMFFRPVTGKVRITLRRSYLDVKG